MKILVIGATGQIGRLLVPKLLADRHSVTALVRDEARGQALAEQGAELVVTDLEDNFNTAFKGIEAVIYTAGSGASTGKDKTLTIDLWSAVKSVRWAEAEKAQRFLLVSALKADNPDLGNEAIKPYLVAKHAADEILKSSELDYTILRPGRLTDEDETGNIHAATQLDDYHGSISRANVAECIRLSLKHPNTSRQVIDLLDGDHSIQEALDQLR